VKGDGKQMIAGAIGEGFGGGAFGSAAGQLVESKTHVETGTGL